MYRTVDALFWTDEDVRDLRPDAKFLFLYLITNPHGHVSGIYSLIREWIVSEIGWPKRKVNTLCDTLSSAGFVRFDTKNHIVWVKNMLRYQGRGEKNERGARSQLKSLPKSPLILEFLDYYPAVKELMGDTLLIGYRGQGKVATPDQDQDQDIKNPKKDSFSATPKTATAEPSERTSLVAQARELYQLYPRKIDPDAAVAEIVKALKDIAAAHPDSPNPFVFLRDRTAAYAASPSGQKPPPGEKDWRLHPQRWFKKKRYNDDPDEWQKPNGEGGHDSAAAAKARADKRKYNEQRQYAKQQAKLDADRAAAASMTDEERSAAWKKLRGSSA